MTPPKMSPITDADTLDAIADALSRRSGDGHGSGGKWELLKILVPVALAVGASLLASREQLRDNTTRINYVEQGLHELKADVREVKTDIKTLLHREH